VDDPRNPIRYEQKALFYRLAPGLELWGAYQRGWLRHDLIAGVSVAAVALPTAIAYAQIIGLEPVAGLYAAIPALLAYALFGTSRHLIVNPDVATCAMIGATLTPLAAGDSGILLSLSVVLAIFTGLFCFAAGSLRLGFVADFLSRPILIGFLNGVAVSIFLGQIGKVFGFPMESHGIIRSFVEFIGKLPQTHWPTLAVGLLAIAVMLAGKSFLPRWPAPLLAVVAAVKVILGLFIGKQVGFMLFSWLAIRSGKAELPDGVTWKQLWGVSCLAGIGFTMSLFVTELAFKHEVLIANAKVGILVASLVSAVVGYFVLHAVLPKGASSGREA
jgi:MFS superfamily sulfate permease-like transporter